tara:strand:+ start:242 stop:691 length:450 start_codon:yes stop_codon:yes gene_type:complete
MIIPAMAGYYWYSSSYGVTDFMVSPEAAREFFEERVVKLNPRISQLQKDRLLSESESAYEGAKTWYPFDGKSEALTYWTVLQQVIPGILYDEDINAIMDIAVETSQDVVSPPDSIASQMERKLAGEDPLLDLPWWVYAGGAVLLFKLLK